MNERPPDTEPGTVVGGDFAVVQPLGRGGMGAVFVAEQLSTGALRALKILHDKYVEDPEVRARFVREARVSAAVDSDHVVQVIAAGFDDQGGFPWLAMELLDGEDLARRVRATGPIPLELARRFVREICHGLGCAHDAGIVHRDLKPHNVFVTKGRGAEGQERIKLLDFGIAKVLASADRVTAALGSPAWMAPEQTASGGRITPATDVWALGLVTFWMLTGRSFWRATQQSPLNMHQLLQEVTMDDLGSPSLRASQLGCGALWPAALDAWFLRCLARRPVDRYADANAAGRALQAALDGEAAAPTTVGEAPPTPPTRSVVHEVTEGSSTARDDAAATMPSPMAGHVAPTAVPTTLVAAGVASAQPKRWRGGWVAAIVVLALGLASFGGWYGLVRETDTAPKKQLPAKQAKATSKKRKRSPPKPAPTAVPCPKGICKAFVVDTTKHLDFRGLVAPARAFGKETDPNVGALLRAVTGKLQRGKLMSDEVALVLFTFRVSGSEDVLDVTIERQRMVAMRRSVNPDSQLPDLGEGTVPDPMCSNAQIRDGLSTMSFDDAIPHVWEYGTWTVSVAGPYISLIKPKLPEKHVDIYIDPLTCRAGPFADFKD